MNTINTNNTMPTVLVVEDDPQSAQLIYQTLSDVGAGFITAKTSSSGMEMLSANKSIRLILCPMQSARIDGLNFARQLRQQKSAEQIQLLMIVADSDLQKAGMAIEAGANDVLIAPFEARELRMLANLQPVRDHRRIDGPHATNSSQNQQSTAETQEATVTEPEVAFIRPFFDVQTMKYTYAASPEQIQSWQSDDRVTRVLLDTILTCPACHSVPTFRNGCSNCGSAVVEQQRLLHHFACAHVGSEHEFRSAENGLSCPKCLQKDLVVGSDFEVTAGPFRCGDCRQIINTMSLIGHCVCCELRFPAAEAVSMPLYGFHVHGVRSVRIPAATSDSDSALDFRQPAGVVSRSCKLNQTAGR